MAPRGTIRRRDVVEGVSLDEIEDIHLSVEEVNRLARLLERTKPVEICLYNFARYEDRPFNFCIRCTPLSPNCALCPYRKAINVKIIDEHYVVAADQRQDAPSMRRGGRNYRLVDRKFVPI